MNLVQWWLNLFYPKKPQEPPRREPLIVEIPTALMLVHAQIESEKKDRPMSDKKEPKTEIGPGILVRDSFRPTNPALTNGSDNRRWSRYQAVIDQFEVEHNPRYTADHQGKGETYCNIFLWDVTKAMSCEVPHWIDAEGEPTGVGRGKELNANAVFDWLAGEGFDHGWKRCTATEAVTGPLNGFPTIVVWKNPLGIGHIAVCVPTKTEDKGSSIPYIAQAGKTNFSYGLITKGFGDRSLTFYIHD